jgi:hypothetical protein
MIMIDIERIAVDPVYAEMVKMDKREEDGRMAYRKTQAGLRLQRLQAGISDAIYTEFVYLPMDGVINKINGGNWLDAYNIIFAIPSNAYLTSAMLLGFKNQIANYIVGEGAYAEYTGRTIDALTGIINH